MQRTKYFNETRPSDLQLNWTDDSKASALSQRTLATAQMGIRAGFEVAVNGTENWKIDIATGEGYTGGNYIINSFEGSGSGERISTITDTPTGTITKTYTAQGVSLADPAYGIRNYVSLIYAENEFYPLAERAYPFTEHDSVVVDSYTVSVLTETNWNLLSVSSLNNRVLVAIVTGGGDHVALTSADIEQFTQPLTHPTCSQPGVLLGVTIVSVSDATSLGIATLIWNKTASTLNWAAPGDTAGAAPVLITDSGSFTLTSNNTNYTVVVNVVFSSLQPLDSALENLTISSLYGRTIPMFSAVDQIHRDMVGSGQVTVRNPHGLSLTDISGGGFDHADLFHLNGISVDADADQLVCRIGEPLSPPEDNRILVKNLGGFNNSFLVDGTTLDSLAGVAAGSEGSTLFTVDIAKGDYLVYVTNDGRLHKLSIASGSVDNPLWNTYIKIIDIENTVVGSCTLSWNTTSRSLSYQPADEDDDVGAPVYLPATNYTGYYKVYSANETNWVIVEVTGDLGTTSSRSFTCSKENTTYPNESMLKLCVVNWSPSTQTLSVLRDVRSYVTADNRAQAEEEHDTQGKHTKVLGQALRVAVATGPGLAAWASTSHAIIASAAAVAISASAQSNAIYAYAATYNGLVAVASNTAVNASASNAQAVLARASVSAVVARATNSFAVDASAPNLAIYGYAGNFAIKGLAASAVGGAAYVVGVEGTAVNSYAGSEQYALGMYANVDRGTALLARVHTNGYGILADVAATGTGVAGVFYNSGIGHAAVVSAADSRALSVVAPSSAIVAMAVGSQAVIGQAGMQAVYGLATNNYGVVGVANGSTNVKVYGIEGHADNIYVGSQDQAVGVVGHVTAGTGLYGRCSGAAADSPGMGVYGLAGSAGTAGVRGNCDASTSLPAYGVEGWAQNSATASNATAVYGHLTDGTAIYGLATNGIGAYGFGGSKGVVGVGNDALPGGTFVYGVEANAANTSAGSQQNAAALFAHLASGTAVYAKVTNSGYGIFVTAPARAIVATALGTAVSASVNGDTAIIGIATGAIGVHGFATNTGVQGGANIDVGVYGNAVSSYGVKGEAGNYGVYGTAIAAGATGVVGIANQVHTLGIGVYGSAGTGTAVEVINGQTFGAGAYGLYGKAGTAGCGVYGTAGLLGACGICTGDYVAGTTPVGVLGVAHGTQAVAVQGIAMGSFGIGGAFYGDTVGLFVAGQIHYFVAKTAAVGGETPVAFCKIEVSNTTYRLALYAT